MEEHKGVFCKEGLPIHWLYSSTVSLDPSVTFLPAQWKWFSPHPFFPVALYSWAHCEHVSWRCRDQPLQFMSNSAFASGWKKKRVCVGGLTLAVRQRENSHLYPTIYPSCSVFLSPSYHRPCKSMGTFHPLEKKIVCIMGQRGTVELLWRLDGAGCKLIPITDYVELSMKRGVFKDEPAWETEEMTSTYSSAH